MKPDTRNDKSSVLESKAVSKSKSLREERANKIKKLSQEEKKQLNDFVFGLGTINPLEEK